MSVTTTHTPAIAADRHRRANDSDEIAVTASVPPAHSGDVIGRFMSDALFQGDPAGVEQLIAHVLGRAHRTAQALNAPNEARAILHVAESFADELATTNPRFDRLRFITAATEGSS
jgi:hypothetical protein